MECKEKTLYHWIPTEKDTHSCFFAEYKIVLNEVSSCGISMYVKYGGGEWFEVSTPLLSFIKHLLLGIDDCWIVDNCGKEIAKNRTNFETEGNL